jgi:ParB-like chromosome segregation protein Spo0J
VELVDGFKRLAAAEALGWAAVSIVVRPLDEMGQWAAMLPLNRGPVSMTTLEEALVLREMVKTGLMQTEVASLCARHKTWVSRRVGLVDRLHPELIEALKLGLLHPGSVRLPLSLPGQPARGLGGGAERAARPAGHGAARGTVAPGEGAAGAPDAPVGAAGEPAPAPPGDAALAAGSASSSQRTEEGHDRRTRVVAEGEEGRLAR